MKLRTLLAINAILSLVGGIACILIPVQLLASFGVTLSPMGLVIYQFWGAALIGVGLLSWLARKIEDGRLQRSIALALFITHAINAVVAVRGQWAGANEAGWSQVALYSLLALGFAFFVVNTAKRPAKTD